MRENHTSERTERFSRKNLLPTVSSSYRALIEAKIQLKVKGNYKNV